MRPDTIGEPMSRTDHDALGRLASIEHRLHHIATRLTALGQALSHLEEIRANLDTLIEATSANSVRLPMNSAEPASQHRATLLQRASLPVRSPGQHLHPQLRHQPCNGPSAELRVARETVPYQ